MNEFAYCKGPCACTGACRPVAAPMLPIYPWPATQNEQRRIWLSSEPPAYTFINGVKVYRDYAAYCDD